MTHSSETLRSIPLTVLAAIELCVSYPVRIENLTLPFQPWVHPAKNTPSKSYRHRCHPHTHPPEKQNTTDRNASHGRESHRHQEHRGEKSRHSGGQRISLVRAGWDVQHYPGPGSGARGDKLSAGAGIQPGALYQVRGLTPTLARVRVRVGVGLCFRYRGEHNKRQDGRLIKTGQHVP